MPRIKLSITVSEETMVALNKDTMWNETRGKVIDRWARVGSTIAAARPLGVVAQELLDRGLKVLWVYDLRKSKMTVTSLRRFLKSSRPVVVGEGLEIFAFRPDGSKYHWRRASD